MTSEMILDLYGWKIHTDRIGTVGSPKGHLEENSQTALLLLLVPQTSYPTARLVSNRPSQLRAFLK